MFLRKIIPLLAVAIILLSGCGTVEFFSKSSYFDGDVVLEYKQTRSRDHNDYVTFRFYQQGTYQITFSITPGKSDRDKEYLPKDFTKAIQQVPREIVVEQYVLPNFLRVTITRDGVSESHDFS